MNVRSTGHLIVALGLALALVALPGHQARAATAQEIDADVDAALERFVKEVKEARGYLDAAKGILVIPGVTQAGFVVGGEYGEGVLRINRKTVDYYNIVSASLGLQIGVQQKDIILVFMDEHALKKFRSGEGWQAGIDGTVAVITTGAEGSIDSTKMNQPIVGFVFGQKGLMAGVTLEGAKISKLKK
jgi:lipid-binding SYLF domain-containing protein